MQRLTRAGNGGDGQAIGVNSSGNPGVGVRAEHRRQPESDPAPCQLGTGSFGCQLLLGVRALEVGTGLVSFVHRQRVVRPCAVNGHRRSEHKRPRASQQHVPGALEVGGAHFQCPAAAAAFPDLGCEVVEHVDTLKGAPGGWAAQVGLGMDNPRSTGRALSIKHNWAFNGAFNGMGERPARHRAHLSDGGVLDQSLEQ